MDDLKRRLSDSVQFRLSFSLTLAILLVAVVAGAVTFAAALEEAHELQDDVLRRVAELVGRQATPAPAPATGQDREQEDTAASAVIVQRLADGAPTASPGSAPALALPPSLPDGLHTVPVGGVPFRVLIATARTGERIAVAQATRVRDEAARESAVRTVMPFLILLPILLLVVARLVRKMFQPIRTLSEEIDRRPGEVLDPIPASRVPSEVRAFVVAINRLLRRVEESLAAQRRFVADAAHELRSPLSALSLQAERLGEAEMSATARERLTSLRRGVERGRRLLEQLLTLAKAQATASAPETPVSVREVYRRVLEDVLPLAEAKDIDVGVEGDQDAQVWVSEADLTIVVRNLVDNAIRYTPSKGRVDLAVDIAGDRAVLRVKDTGPGIPPHERDRVFEPFYRASDNDRLGSGLGLAIVKAIADRVNAEVRLSSADEATASGLCVSVSVPARPSRQFDHGKGIRL
jgi:two-component system, OmpR family, sensor kinase